VAHRLAVLRHAEEVSGNVSRPCRYYGITRQSFYKWRRRYETLSEAGLEDRNVDKLKRCREIGALGESIGEPLLLSGLFDKKQINTRVEELLEQVELPQSFRNRYPHELSGGQRQRIGIARALALSPKLLVADEPTSALDVSVQARVLELLQEIQSRLKFACLFVSHDLAVVDLLADRIVVMNHGKIVEQGNKEDILRNPQEAYTQRLIAAVPLPDPAAQKLRREQRAAS